MRTFSGVNSSSISHPITSNNWSACKLILAAVKAPNLRAQFVMPLVPAGVKQGQCGAVQVLELYLFRAVSGPLDHHRRFEGHLLDQFELIHGLHCGRVAGWTTGQGDADNTGHQVVTGHGRRRSDRHVAVVDDAAATRKVESKQARLLVVVGGLTDFHIGLGRIIGDGDGQGIQLEFHHLLYPRDIGAGPACEHKKTRRWRVKLIHHFWGSQRYWAGYLAVELNSNSYTIFFSPDLI